MENPGTVSSRTQQRADLQFNVLGPLEVYRFGAPVDLGSAKQRTVLAALVVSANRTVAVDTLIDDVWGDEPPAQALNAVQTYVSKLRRLLEPDRRPRQTPTVLRSTPPGYLLSSESGAIDAHRFGRLATEARADRARGDLGAARRHLRSALELWRGAALADVADRPFARAEAARLEELRVGCIEERVAVDLSLGDHAAVAAELQHLVERMPSRERLWEQLMLALYRCGRQADALDAYQRCRTMLTEHLGIDPGPALQRMEHAVLVHDPDLDWRDPGSAADVDATRAAEPPATSSPDHPFVGRHQPLTTLTERWESAQAGAGSIVLIGGESGIGKTRLATEFATVVAADVGQVRWAHCHERSGAPAFWPWIQVMKGVTVADFPDVVQATLDATGVPPEASGHPRPTPGHDADASADPHAERFHLLQAATVALNALASTRPTVVVLDDLQWADPASLHLLEMLAPTLRHSPMLIVATVREDEAVDDAALSDVLPSLDRSGELRRIWLGGLSAPEVGELIRIRTGAAPAPNLVENLHDRTAGHPFFVQELVTLLAAGHPLEDADSAVNRVPQSVRDVVHRRLTMLPRDVGTLLTAAAVLGAEFDLPALEAVSEVKPPALLDAIDRGVGSGLLLAHDPNPATYRFSHALVREAIYEDTTPVERTRLHAAAARALEIRHGDDERHVLEIAHHQYRAVGAIDARDALDGLLRAVEVATGQLGYEQAEEMLAQALAVLTMVPHDEERDRLELSLQARLATSVAATKGVNAPDSRAAWSRARTLSSANPAAPEGLASLFGQLMVAWSTNDVAQARRCARALSRTVEHASADSSLVDPSAEYLAAAGRGLTALVAGEVARARDELEFVRTVVERDANPWVPDNLWGDPRVSGSGMCALVATLAGEVDVGRALSDVCLDHAADADHGYSTSAGLMTCVWTATIARDVDRVATFAQQCAQLGSRHNLAISTQADMYIAWTMAQEGDTDRALDLKDQSLRQSAASGARPFQSLYLCVAAEIDHLAGRPQAALDTIDHALDAVKTWGECMYEAELHRLRGEILLTAGTGSDAQAMRSLERAIDIAGQQGSGILAMRAADSLAMLAH